MSVSSHEHHKSEDLYDLASSAEAEAELRQLVRKIRLQEVNPIGLVAPDDLPSLEHLATRIALALADAAGCHVTAVDAGSRWAEAHARRPSVPTAGLRFVERSLGERLDLLTPERDGAGLVDLSALEATLSAMSERTGWGVVDLSGLARHGLLLSAARSLAGTLVVARANRTTEDELSALRDALGDAPLLGVVLLG